MQISVEGYIGIALGLLALGGAGAIMIAPNRLEIGWALIAISGIGFILLGYHIVPKYGWQQMLWSWGPWALIVGGPLVGALLLYVRSDSTSGHVEWAFLQTGNAIQLEWQQKERDGPLTFFVPGFIFSGKNGPEKIHQIDASVTITHNQATIPLFIAADGQWINFSDSSGIPPRARFQIGCQMRSDTLHCAGFPERISPERFLTDIGGFSLKVAFDGEAPQEWHFSLADIRKQFDKQMKEAIEMSRAAAQVRRK